MNLFKNQIPKANGARKNNNDIILTNLLLVIVPQKSRILEKKGESIVSERYYLKTGIKMTQNFKIFKFK